MRITAVETVVVGAELRNWVFVKVVTDEPGLVGWGEATLEWKTRAVTGAVADLAPLVLGEDPFAVERLWQAMLGGVAVLQPDVCHVGGPTALRKIAALAESHRVALAPHNPLGPVATAVNQHLGFTLPGFLLQEVMRSDVPWRDEVVTGGLPIVAGHVGLPTALGWGVAVDEVAAARHPYQPEPQLRTALADGSIADW